jgi:hypothetical protein
VSPVWEPEIDPRELFTKTRFNEALLSPLRIRLCPMTTFSPLEAKISSLLVFTAFAVAQCDNVVRVLRLAYGVLNVPLIPVLEIIQYPETS